MDRRIGLLSCAPVAALALWGAASSASAGSVTSWNFDPYWPTTCSCSAFTGFQVILPGDQTGIALTYYNSFPDPKATVTFDGTNTTVLFTSNSGGTIPLGMPGGSYGPSGSPVPHFGLAGDIPGTGGEKLPPLAMQWLYGSSTVDTPTLGAQLKSGAHGKTKYLIEYVTVIADPGHASGSWFELPYTGSYQQTFIASPSTPVSLANANFFISPTEIPLDQLNLNELSDPRFKPIPQVPDGTGILAGGTVGGSASPEPASWIMLIAGFCALGATLRRRSIRPAAG